LIRLKEHETAAFDHDKLAKALISQRRSFTASMLPFQSINYSPDGKVMIFSADENNGYDLASGAVTSDTALRRTYKEGRVV
jgi:hypothetical protein